MTSHSIANVPAHVAIILDGNRRWAKERHLPAIMGHRAGYDNLKKLAEYGLSLGIEHLTLFVFSTENWKRHADEVSGIMDILEQGLKNDFAFFEENSLRLRWVGFEHNMNPQLTSLLRDTVKKTAGFTRGQLNLCLNYGSRLDLVMSIRKMVAEEAEITEDSVAAHLQTAGLPEPDLIIRTSGEQRLSNFLLWEGAYSELYFSEKYWPDFDRIELDKALAEYAVRQRRYGK